MVFGDHSDFMLTNYFFINIFFNSSLGNLKETFTCISFVIVKDLFFSLIFHPLIEQSQWLGLEATFKGYGCPMFKFFNFLEEEKLFGSTEDSIWNGNGTGNKDNDNEIDKVPETNSATGTFTVSDNFNVDSGSGAKWCYNYDTNNNSYKDCSSKVVSEFQMEFQLFVLTLIIFLTKICSSYTALFISMHIHPTLCNKRFVKGKCQEHPEKYVCASCATKHFRRHHENFATLRTRVVINKPFRSCHHQSSYLECKLLDFVPSKDKIS